MKRKLILFDLIGLLGGTGINGVCGIIKTKDINGIAALPETTDHRQILATGTPMIFA